MLLLEIAEHGVETRADGPSHVFGAENGPSVAAQVLHALSHFLNRAVAMEADDVRLAKLALFHR